MPGAKRSRRWSPCTSTRAPPGGGADRAPRHPRALAVGAGREGRHRRVAAERAGSPRPGGRRNARGPRPPASPVRRTRRQRGIAAAGVGATGAEAGEAREVHDRLQATLADRGRAEEALRQELERLRGEAAARRQADEAQLGERDRREEALRRDKEFLEGVIDGSPAGIFAHDRDGRCRVWNAALERLLGRPRSDALGRTAAELFPPADGHDSTTEEEGPAAENGAARVEAVLGRSEFFESATPRSATRRAKSSAG